MIRFGFLIFMFNLWIKILILTFNWGVIYDIKRDPTANTFHQFGFRRFDFRPIKLRIFSACKWNYILRWFLFQWFFKAPFTLMLHIPLILIIYQSVFFFILVFLGNWVVSLLFIIYHSMRDNITCIWSFWTVVDRARAVYMFTPFMYTKLR